MKLILNEIFYDLNNFIKTKYLYFKNVYILLLLYLFNKIKLS